MRKENYFECKICRKGFLQKPYLNQHMKTVHEKRKDFLCEVCCKAFGQKGTPFKTTYENSL